MAWTVRQKEAIVDTGNNLLLSAAAGSGKTSVLVERIKNLITGKSVDINSMLIVTFTKAAAGEMKSRLRSNLGIDVSKADICTYDSFAQKIIKNYYHVIGINPKLKICDSYKSSILENDSMDELFKKLYESNDPDFIDFLDHYTNSKNDNNAREMILGLFHYVDTLPDPEGFLNCLLTDGAFDPNSLIESCIPDICENLGTAANGWRLLSEFMKNNGMEKLSVKAAANALSIDDIASVFSEKRMDDGCLKLSQFKAEVLRASKDETEAKKANDEYISYLKDKCIKTSFDKAKGLCDGLSFDVLENELELVRKPLTQLVNLTLSFMEIFSDKKKKEGLMGFSDGSHYALKILQNESVCKELREKYEYIFVDEYQDSNAVQEELIQRIARENNLFMVGDVKQSIYKFRHAEPELFLDKYSRYKQGQAFCKLIDLNDNFRSKPWVIDCINNIFRNVMTRSSCYIEYDDNAALKEGAPKYEGDIKADPKLYLLSSDSDDDTDNEIDNLKNIQLEALMCVEIIKEHSGEEYFDKKSGKVKKLEYKDMVILLRKLKGTAEVFYKALADAGIPVYMQRNEGYFDTPEIEILINLLKIIDNIKQDIPLISVLHFPCFDFSVENLAEIRIYGKEHGLEKSSFYDVFRYYAQNTEGDLSERCSSFLEKINTWKLRQKTLSLADFIWELLFESNIYMFISASKDAQQRLANIRAFVDKAAAFEKNNTGGLYAFLNYISIISSDNSKVSTGQSKILSESDNVVRIMTIHASKGLEFPFVLVANLGSKLKGRDSHGKLVCSKDMGASMVLTNPGNYTKYSPKSFRLIKAKQEKDEHAEAIRVLYVAATRAKDFLYFSGVCRNSDEYREKKNAMLLSCESAGTYLDMVYPCMDEKNVIYFNKNKLKLPSFRALREDELRKQLYEGFDIDESKLSVPEAELRARFETDYKGTAEGSRKKYSVSEIVAEINLKENGGQQTYKKSAAVPAFLSEDRKPDSAELGTAIHTVMEQIPFTLENKDPEDIKAFMQGLVERNILTEEESKLINPEIISTFFSSDIARAVCSSKHIEKEASFVLKTDYEGKTVLVQGTIDCYCEEGDGLVLLDYKSNYINKSKKEEDKVRIKREYAPQLALYKQALEEICGKKVKKAYLYLFSIGEFLEFEG